MLHYMNYIPEEFKDRTIPTFIKLFLEEEKLSDDDKYKFINTFLINYLNDNHFRESVQGWALYVVNLKYIGYYKSEYSDQLWQPGIRILNFEINDNPEPLYELLSYSETIEINSNVTNMNINFFLGSGKFNQSRILDTGASHTTIPLLDYWDRMEEKFDINICNKTINKVLKQRIIFQLEYLNSNIKKTKKDNFNTSVGLNKKLIIEWVNPLIISLGDLPPILLDNSIAPLTEGANANVIGLNVISKYNVQIQTFNETIFWKFQSSSNYNIPFTILNTLEYKDIDDLNKIADDLKETNSLIKNTKLFFGFNSEHLEYKSIKDDYKVKLQEIYNDKISELYSDILYYLLKTNNKKLIIDNETIFSIAQKFNPKWKYIYNNDISTYQKENFTNKVLIPYILHGMNLPDQYLFYINNEEFVFEFN